MAILVALGPNSQTPADGGNGRPLLSGTNFANRLGAFEDLSETFFETVGLGLGLGLGLATGG